MNRHLLRKNTVPTGGAWFYTIPETGATLEDRMSLDGLVLKAQAHYEHNKLTPPPNLRDLIEDYICDRMPAGVCSGDPATVRRLGFFDVLRATELLFHRAVRGEGILVEREESGRRASICASCPLNLQHMCTTCNGLRETFQKLVARRSTAFDNRLGVCSACGCGLVAKVHVKKKFLPPMPADVIGTVPKNCWALPASS